MAISIHLSIFTLFFKIYFNWRPITLQYCIGFAIHWHESAMGEHVSPSWTPLPPPSPSHPSGSSQCTSPEHPVSCIETRLVICFTYANKHVSVLFYRSSHPRLLPQSPKDCSIHQCLSYRIIGTIFLNSIYMR